MLYVLARDPRGLWLVTAHLLLVRVSDPVCKELLACLALSLQLPADALSGVFCAFRVWRCQVLRSLPGPLALGGRAGPHVFAVYACRVSSFNFRNGCVPAGSGGLPLPYPQAGPICYQVCSPALRLQPCCCGGDEERLQGPTAPFPTATYHGGICNCPLKVTGTAPLLKMGLAGSPSNKAGGDPGQ